MNWFAKKEFDGGGYLKNPCKSYGCLSKTLKLAKYFSKQFREKFSNFNKILTFARYDKIGGVGPRARKASRTAVFWEILRSTSVRTEPVTSIVRKLRFRAANCGSILIEFAFCMPVLIILLFYIHDLVKIKRMYSQTEFVGQQIANILQNISQKRASKAITLTDIKHACTLAWQTIPSNSENLQAYTNV